MEKPTTADLAKIVELNAERIAVMERLVAKHIETCDENRGDMKKVIELVQAMEGSLKMARWARSFIMYVSGFAGAVYGLWKMYKGG